MEIDTSRLTLQRTQERVVEPDTTSVTRTVSDATRTPPIDTVATQAAVETTLYPQMSGNSQASGIARDEAVQRILTEFLTTLLEELDTIIELPAPGLAGHLDEIVTTTTDTNFNDADNSEAEGSLKTRSHLPPNSTSSLLGRPINSESLREGTSTHVTAAPSQKESEKSSNRSSQTNLIDSQKLSSPDVSSSQTGSTRAGTANNQPQVGTHPSFEIASAARESRNPPSSTAPQNRKSVEIPVPTDARVHKAQHDTADESALRSAQGVESGATRQSRGTSESTPSTKPLLPDRSAAQPPQSRMPSTIDNAAISTYRDLIRSLLSQPGGVANQLESGVAKALIAALSNETTSELLEALSQNASSAGKESAGKYLLSREQIRASNIPAEMAKKGSEVLLRGEEGIRQNIEKSRGKSETELQITSSQHSIPLKESVPSPSQSSSSPLAFSLRGSVGVPLQNSRVHVGILSDPALLSALQVAALKRTYSDIPKLKKRSSLNKRTSQGTTQERLGNDRENLNDTSRESTGLSLLRAYLERRSELSGN